MKKQLFLLPLLLTVGGLASCGSSDVPATNISGSESSIPPVDNKITICASELPHAKILKEAIKPVLQEKGFSLDVRVLDWTQQNSAVARGEYDANYFQHQPYLDTYNKDAGADGALKMVVKAHFEKLCLYASDVNNKVLKNGDKIEIVNDVSNIERALLLLKDNGILTGISESCYDEEGVFTTFNINNPNSQVTFAEQYSNCTITCIKESLLVTSLLDYQFGVLPGNAALTGLGDDYAQRIVFGEKVTEEVLSLRANGVAVKPANASSKKTAALVEAFADESVKNYIQNTFGESVVYHYENLNK